MKKKTLFYVCVGTYLVLVVPTALISIFLDGNDWLYSCGDTLFYIGFGVAVLGFLFLRGATALGLGLRRPGNKIISEQQYVIAHREQHPKAVEQTVWMIIFAAMLVSLTGYFLLRL